MSFPMTKEMFDRMIRLVQEHLFPSIGVVVLSSCLPSLTPIDHR